MAFDITPRTEQEQLNIKAGFTGPLRTKQECWWALGGFVNSANSVYTTGTTVASYCGGSGSQQNRMNFKVGSTGNTLTKQEAIRRL